MLVDLKSYRPKHVTIQAAALTIRKSDRQLIRYETGEQTPGDHDIIKLAELYEVPQMIFEHLGYQNDIGRRFLPRPLNSINRSFPAICFKSREELEEMVGSVESMCRMVLNGQDLDTWGMTEQFDRHFQELIDVEQLVLEAKIRYAEIRGLKVLEERYREHDRKCVANGYRVEKKITPQAVETRARYQCSI